MRSNVTLALLLMCVAGCSNVNDATESPQNEPLSKSDFQVIEGCLTDILYGVTPAIDEAIQILDSNGFTEIAIKGSSYHATLSVPPSDAVAARKLLQDNPVKGTTILYELSEASSVNHK